MIDLGRQDEGRNILYSLFHCCCVLLLLLLLLMISCFYYVVVCDLNFIDDSYKNNKKI